MFSMLLSMATLACKNEAPQDVDPCARATSNARRLATAEPALSKPYGADPLSAERCHAITSKETVKCLGYASSWSELTECSPDAIRPISDLPASR